MIAGGEQWHVEFKGESKAALNDADLVDAVVCLANNREDATSSFVLIGVEDDGRITGARRRHGVRTEANLLIALIRNRTVPSVEVRVSTMETADGEVIVVEVPRTDAIVSTPGGRTLRRVMRTHGPSFEAMTAIEIGREPFRVGQRDYSAEPLTDATVGDLDSFEIARLRRTIEAAPGHADHRLLELGDEELLKALNLVVTVGGRSVPTVAGMLVIGREDALRRALPTHEVFVQIFGSSTELVLNRRLAGPLVAIAEEIQSVFAGRNIEQEFFVRGYRLAIPDYAADAFREALHNALLHRDYTENAAVHIQWSAETLTIISPGGFLPGITLDNLIVHEPKPRNRTLADVFQRIGLVERSGRGIDRIYEGQLRYGRPIPNFGRSDHEAVRLLLHGGAASRELTAFVYGEIAVGRSLGVPELLIVDHLRRVRHAVVAELAHLIQRSDGEARNVLERMVIWDVLEARGQRRGRFYLLSGRVHGVLGDAPGYIRSRGFARIQQGAMIMELVEQQGRIRRAEAMDLCHLTVEEARSVLRHLVESGKLRPVGERRGTYYVKAE